MSYYVNQNVSMKVNKNNQELCEKIWNFASDFVKESDADFAFRVKNSGKDFAEISYHFNEEIDASCTRFLEECGTLADEANDGSYVIEMCTGDFGVYYNHYGSVNPVEKKLSEIRESADWYRENEIFLCVSAPSDVQCSRIESLIEELQASSLCGKLEFTHKNDGGTTYYLCEMLEWRSLNKDRFTELMKLINEANEKAAKLGAKVTIVDEPCTNDPETYFNDFIKNDIDFITEDCSSALVLATKENGISDVKVIAFEK